jgi:predicted AlkP superfamily pyrophosphatase or phosphodiesterase
MKPRLIICIDGLGFDLISEENTPFLHVFGKENYFSELETLFAFTGIEYCFFSGKNPDETDIWLEFSKESNSVFDSFLMRIFGVGKLRDYVAVLLQLMNNRTWMSGIYNIPKDKLKYFDTSAKKGLWELDFFRNKGIAFYKWPFFVTERKKKLIFKYEDDEERLQRLLSEKGKEVYYVQLMKVDKAIHKFGKESPEVRKTLKKTDLLLEKYVKSFLNENPEGEVFLWGDHSLADIKNYINLEKMLPKSREYLYFIEGTTACFWFKNEEIKKRVLESVKEEKRIKILNTKKAKSYKIPLSKKYGDLVIYVEKGNYFFPNFYQKNNKEKFMAMHGYPNDKELNGMVISNKKIPKKIKMAEMIKYIK